MAAAGNTVVAEPASLLAWVRLREQFGSTQAMSLLRWSVCVMASDDRYTMYVHVYLGYMCILDGA
jgi:hypothetical protein